MNESFGSYISSLIIVYIQRIDRIVSESKDRIFYEELPDINKTLKSEISRKSEKLPGQKKLTVTVSYQASYHVICFVFYPPFFSYHKQDNGLIYHVTDFVIDQLTSSCHVTFVVIVVLLV